MVAKSANPKGLTNDCQVKWKNWPDSSIRAFFLRPKWQSNKPQNWANVVETIMIISPAGKTTGVHVGGYSVVGRLFVYGMI